MSRVTSRALGVAVAVGITYWWSVFGAMHLLQPELSPIRAPGSAYVLGARGEWMTTTYFVLAASILSAGLGLRGLLPAAGLVRVGFAACAVASAGAILAGLFPMDFPGPPHTASGRLHALGGLLTFPTWVLGTVCFSVSVRRTRRLGGAGGLLRRLSIGAIGMLALMFLSIFLGFGGLAQRLLLMLLFGWTLVVGLQLIRSGDNAAWPQPNKPLQPPSGAS